MVLDCLVSSNSGSAAKLNLCDWTLLMFISTHPLQEYTRGQMTPSAASRAAL